MLVEKSKPTQGFHDVHKLIYGPPKVGKTTLTSHFEKDGKPALHLMTEDGHQGLEIYARRLGDWQDFEKVVDTLTYKCDEVRTQFSTIVIDLVSELDEMATRYSSQTLGSYIGDVPHGKGWYFQKETFRSRIHALMGILPLTFICHSKEKEIEWQHKTQTMIVPAYSNSCKDFIGPKAAIIGYMAPGKSFSDKPKITFRPSSNLIAGSRFKGLLTQDFEIDPQDVSGSILKMETAMNGETHDCA